MKPVVIVGGSPEIETASLIREIAGESEARGEDVADLFFLGSDERSPSLHGRADFVVLDLESPELVRLSEEISSKVLWFSEKPPQKIAGPLLESFSGAYFRAATGEVVFCHGTSELECEEVYPVESHSDATLAAICVARAAGVPPDVIRRALRK